LYLHFNFQAIRDFVCFSHRRRLSHRPWLEQSCKSKRKVLNFNYIIDPNFLDCAAFDRPLCAVCCRGCRQLRQHPHDENEVRFFTIHCCHQWINFYFNSIFPGKSRRAFPSWTATETNWESPRWPPSRESSPSSSAESEWLLLAWVNQIYFLILNKYPLVMLFCSKLNFLSQRVDSN